MNRKALLFIVAVLASAALSARANLVANPGFETGDFSSWVNAGSTTYDSVSTFAPHTGVYAANLGSITISTLSQMIPTTPGLLYDVSFWLRQDSTSGDNSFTAAFAGVVGFTAQVNGPAFPYTQFSFDNVLATSASSLLIFTDHNGPSWWRLDDVSVVQVPEPGTLGLIALGALGLVGAVRKRFLV